MTLSTFSNPKIQSSGIPIGWIHGCFQMIMGIGGLMGIAFCLMASTTWANDTTRMGSHERGNSILSFQDWNALVSQGDPKAQNNLGVLYAEGKGVPQDHQKAFFWYRQAAEKGNPVGQLNLGYSFANGLGRAKDLEKALSWYHKSAIQGNPVAAFNLGVIYEQEKSVRNYDLALQWYHVAANRCSTKAMMNIGTMYNKGKGVPQDIKKALDWNQRAAELGDKYAQYKVGLRFWDNQILPQDFVKAYMWLSLASQQDEHQEFALQNLLLKKMSSRQISNAQNLARQWRPRTCSQH